MTLPTDPKARKRIPIYSGFIKYFPLAIIEVAKVSYAGNAQHNGPDAPMKWDRSKSGDELDALMRHLFDNLLETPAGETEHLAHAAWRAMAELQKHMERKQNAETSNRVDKECGCTTVGEFTRICRKCSPGDFWNEPSPGLGAFGEPD